MLGETRLAPDRHARARPDRELRARRRHRPERGGRQRDARAPRRSCSSRSTSARTRAASTSAHTGRSAGSSTTSPSAATARTRSRDFVSGMTDRFALSYAELALMARIKEQSVREVVAAADMVEVVNGRTSLRRAGARWTGRCPFHEERTPSFSVNPVEKLFYCFGCGKGGDVITFVRETESARLRRGGRMARRAVQGHARVRGDLAAARGRPAAARSAARAARAGDGLLRAAPLGLSGGGARAGISGGARAAGGHLPRVPPRALAGRRSRTEGAGEGLHAGGAAGGRADQRARQRLLPAPADVSARRRARPDRRLPGAQAPRRRSDARQVRQLARRRSSSTSRPSSTVSTWPEPRSRSRSAPWSSRGTPT